MSGDDVSDGRRSIVGQNGKIPRSRSNRRPIVGRNKNAKRSCSNRRPFLKVRAK